MSPIRIFIADDHPLFILGVVTSLEGDRFKVVGQTSNPLEVEQKFKDTNADVLVLDVLFGEGPSGLEIARDVLLASPKARIVFYSQFDDDETIREAYRLGGAAIIKKSVEPSFLAAAIEHAYTDPNKPYFLPKIAERLALLSLRGDDSPQSKLSKRDLDVFRMMAEGLTNAEIAEKLDVSTKTISNISQRIKDQLGVQRQAEITRLAIKYMIISP
jgi:DNA-binding NarL/FixJ family response regulator